MDPLTIGAGALGALESLTGGGAGPSSSGPATQGGNDVTVGGLNINRWNPMLLGALALMAFVVLVLLFRKKK